MQQGGLAEPAVEPFHRGFQWSDISSDRLRATVLAWTSRDEVSASNLSLTELTLEPTILRLHEAPANRSVEFLGKRLLQYRASAIIMAYAVHSSDTVTKSFRQLLPCHLAFSLPVHRDAQARVGLLRLDLAGSHAACDQRGIVDDEIELSLSPFCQPTPILVQRALS